MENTISHKSANVDHQIIDVIANRWSPRAFEDRDIEEDTLMKLFEAARWAASSMNEQPWRFIYARKGTPAHEKIIETLMEGNKPWAKKAPILTLNLVKKNFKNGASNKSAHHDLGLAIGNLSIQATYEGIGLHQMGGFSPRKAEQLFNVPEAYEAVTAIAMGYFGDPDQLPEILKQRELSERSRLSLNEIAFENAFDDQS